MALYYIQTNVICLCVLLIIYVSFKNRSGTLPARRIAYNRIIGLIAIVCIADMYAGCFAGQSYKGARVVVQLSNIIYDAAITCTGYAWLEYVELRIKSLDYNYDKHKTIRMIPLIIMLLLLATNPLTNFIFSVDENNVYSRGNGIFIHWIISWFYLFYALAVVLLKVKNTSSKIEKSQYAPLIMFIVPPIIASVFQMFFYGITTIQCGMTLSALIIAVSFILNEVSKDTLTGLNNRHALDDEILEILQKENTKLTVLMCDIDKFKSINDTLGHTAGDIALKRMAEALKIACGESNRRLFLCRYGGDEFVICGTDMEKDEISELISNIEATIEKLNAGHEKGLHFGISVGDATAVCLTYQDVEKLINAADSTMYANKQEKFKK